MKQGSNRKSIDQSHQSSIVVDENYKTKPTENTFQEDEEFRTLEMKISNQKKPTKNPNYMSDQSLKIKKLGKIVSVYTEIIPNPIPIQLQSQTTPIQQSHKNSLLPNIGGRQSILGSNRYSSSVNPISSNRQSQAFNQNYLQSSVQQKKKSSISLNKFGNGKQNINTQSMPSGAFITQQQSDYQQQINDRYSENSNRMQRVNRQGTTVVMSKVVEERQKSSHPSPSNSQTNIIDPVEPIKETIIIEKDREEEEYIPRSRDFTFRPIDRANLFEGLPFVQFESFVRKDKHMQKNIIRDLLKILGDKCHQFKNSLFDRKKLKDTYTSLRSKTKIRLNQSMETLLGVLETTVLLILNDFSEKELDMYAQDPSPLIRQYAGKLQESLESLGLTPSPLQVYRDKYLEIEENPDLLRQYQQQRSVIQQEQQEKKKKRKRE